MPVNLLDDVYFRKDAFGKITNNSLTEKKIS